MDMTQTEVTNADRAKWALDAITKFVEETRADTAVDAITDMIGDLLHLARGRDLDTDLISRNALAMMHSEISEDIEGDMQSVQASFRTLLREDA